MLFRSQVQEWRTRVGGIDDAIVDLVLDSEDAFDALAVAVALLITAVVAGDVLRRTGRGQIP